MPDPVDDRPELPAGWTRMVKSSGLRRRDGVSIERSEPIAVKGSTMPVFDWWARWPVWGPHDLPSAILARRTEAAAIEYIDQRWPMLPWWVEIDQLTTLPPIRIL